MVKKDHPALLQQYIKLRNQRVGLRNMVDHESGAGLANSERFPMMRARSASVTAGSARGVSRKRLWNPYSQIAPSTLISRKPPRHPNG